MRFRRPLIAPLTILLTTLLFVTPAFAWDLAVMTGFNFSHPSLNPDPPNGGAVTTKAAFDFGALTSVSIGGAYLLETGLIRHTRDTVLNDTHSDTESRYSGWLVPLTFRFMRADFFGLGFGPYVEFLSSRTKSTTSYNSGGTVTIDASDPNRKNYEIGFRANLRIVFPVYHESKVIVDGSYLFGVTDLNKSPTVEDKSQDLLILVGFQIPISSSIPDAANAATSISPSDTTASPDTGLAPAVETPLTGPSPTPSSKPAVKKKKEKRK